eukprot:Skav200740  [mRNA]  locus=scaffold1785:14133:18727:+ [translate_table: standard]
MKLASLCCFWLTAELISRPLSRHFRRNWQLRLWLLDGRGMASLGRLGRALGARGSLSVERCSATLHAVTAASKLPSCTSCGEVAKAGASTQGVSKLEHRVDIMAKLEALLLAFRSAVSIYFASKVPHVSKSSPASRAPWSRPTALARACSISQRKMVFACSGYWQRNCHCKSLTLEKSKLLLGLRILCF